MAHMGPDRLLIVSNRLPVVASLDGGGMRITDAEGGLATGLRPWHARAGGLWLGWPGDVSRFTTPQRAELDLRLQQRGIVPVYLSKEQIDRYYHRFSNGVLWPLLHYLIDRVPIDTLGWEAYREVNAAFADAVAEVYADGDLIWVHDYQLMLLPALLRERLPGARIGFFLHVPFPSSEVFRILPWRREILQGLLGADLIGFHTFAYLRHFVASLLHIDGVEANIDRVRVSDRDVALGVFPMGIDAGAFADLARDADVAAAADTIRAEAGGRRILLGVDRLDYTKGIPRRLLAIERLLTSDPSLCDRVRYVQVAVPSRGSVESYRTFRHQVEETVGRINGACATLRSTPIHYMHRSVSTRELVSLYLAADVMLVTPLRDGMNLVAKEFAASRVEDDGVLVLSEFAGAAAELGDAVVVNPYDVDGVVAGIRRALDMPDEERRRRMRNLRARVCEYDVHAWAKAFIRRLAATRGIGARSNLTAPLTAALDAARQPVGLHVLLDYDGTLVPIAEAPELAVPDDELLQLVAALAACEGLAVHLVSGRPRAWLAEWFGDLPIALWAEHGYWHRPAAAEAWRAAAPPTNRWMGRVMAILEQFTASTPGARIEKKDASLAWHYRQADPEFGVRQAHELRMLLGDALSNQPLEVLEGKKVIEIRRRGVGKGSVADRLFHDADERVVAIGDDQTDEELFAALPPTAITIATGSAPTVAKYQVADYRAVRELLWAMALARRAAVDVGASPVP
jgi:trehalose 6-phosphate synthase/phosphatase